MTYKFPHSPPYLSDLVLIISFARSFDKNIKSMVVNKHLVSSSCYVESGLFYEPLKSQARNPDWDPDWRVIEVYSSTLPLYLVEEFTNPFADTKKKFAYVQIPSLLFFSYDFFDKIFFPNPNPENVSPIIPLKNCIFVFRGFVWPQLQLSFREFDISISGGSVSKRHQLKSVSFYLSKFLLDFDIDVPVLYESKNLSKYLDNNLKIADPNSLREKMLNIMRNNLSDKLFVLQEKVAKLESMVDKTKSLLETANQKTNKYNKDPAKFALKKSQAVQSIKVDLNQYLDEINLVKSQIKIEKKELNDVDNCSLSFFEVKNIYFKKYHNEYIKKILARIYRSPIGTPINSINKSTQFSNKRGYSTISSYKDLKVKNNKLNVRNLSLDSLKDNWGFQRDLMLLLYSGEDKETVQSKIETFLISEQNIISKKKLESNNSDLNYNILNPDLLRIFLESQDSLFKLFLNYKSKFNAEIQSPIDKEIYTILVKIPFNEILNILNGKLFLILSNNDLINNFTRVTPVAIDVGLALMNRYYYALSTESDTVDFKTFYNSTLKNSKISKSSDDSDFYLKLGIAVLSWLLELKLIATAVKILSKDEKHSIYIVGDKLNKWKSKSNLPILTLPVKIPMICPPKKYLSDTSNNKFGGYLLNNVQYLEPLIIKNPFLVEDSKLEVNTIVYKMVDDISSVPFAINVEVLEFILKNYKKYNLLIDPDFKHPLTSKLKLTTKEKIVLDSFNSKKNLEAEILNLARIFKDVPEFFIPVRLDYRGRIYCNSLYLNYQGVELAKSLLKFASGEIVYINDTVSINYLKIFGANCFGKDKLSFNDRIEWIDENKDKIINFDSNNLISEAENKLLFIAFCFEFRKYNNAIINNKKSFVTHLPIQLDASCNGFQHLSLLLEDITLADKVNLSEKTWDNTPDDFYTFLALITKKYLEDRLSKCKGLNETILSEEDKKSFERIISIDFKNHRSLVKKTIMTIPYNSTAYSNVDSMKEDFTYSSINEFYVHKVHKELILLNRDFRNIVKALYFCLFREFPKLEKAIEYFKKIAKLSNNLGISITWSLPTGLIVHQEFYDTKTIKFKPFLYRKDLLNLNIIDKKSRNKVKQISSLMPNLVHSLDAASLGLLIDNYFKVNKSKNFYSIHDCFAVTCNNVHLIYEFLKLSYCKIYIKNSFLEKFDRNFKIAIYDQTGIDFRIKNSYAICTDVEGTKIKTLEYPEIKQILNSSDPKPKIKNAVYSVN